MANLIIYGDLVFPPSDWMAVRNLAMTVIKTLKLSVILESDSEIKDSLFSYSLNHGLMDFIEEIVEEREKETGLRLGPENRISKTLITENIRFENQISLLGRIKTLVI